ncbi:MAG: TlpA family protein disulfide reductase [Phocaeicola vulgatus]|nr:TlpA family protein disulfide reductase [Phocaeicola vulgatus]
MKKLTIMMATAALCCCLGSCNSGTKQELANTVHLKGQLLDMGSQNVRMRFDGAASMLGDSRDILLKTDAAGYFDTTFVLKEPTYYTISRNTLYLTPGDDMTIKVTQTNTEAEFSGIGAEANNYMKFRLFPKGGSYLEAGGNLRGDFVSTKALVDSLAAIRMHTLDTLSNVSDAFKKLETARIKADIINSYICYASYSRMFAGVKTEEEMRAKWNEFNVSRDVLSYQEDSTLASLWFKDISIPARTTELYACAKIVDNLRNEASEQTVNEAKAFLQTVKNADFATEIEGKIVQASKLLPGQPAIDFEMLDVEGNVKHLADFKGKVIYIDLWATWCGPCIQESPAFEALGKKYVGKDIVFLPVSTDTTTKPWLRYLDGHKKELTQYHSNDVALKESWAIMYIPRFILIDKDFNIVNAYAPRPSSEEIGTLIDSVLNK